MLKAVSEVVALSAIQHLFTPPEVKPVDISGALLALEKATKKAKHAQLTTDQCLARILKVEDELAKEQVKLVQAKDAMAEAETQRE